jgi:O-antigen ligase
MIPRNCGYAQEPGCFAVYLCLAIFINLFVANSNKNSKKRFLVLVLALISTMSTTGYVIFIVIIVFYILSKDLSKALLLFPIAIIALIYISTLPFMSNKIIDMVNETNTLDQMIISTIGQDEESTPQRFTSFMITFVDFRDNPILGLGPDNDKSWVNKIGAKISPISGIGNLLAQFGIVGFLFFIMASIRSSFYISKYFQYKGKFLLFFIIIFISISYSLIILPLMMIFWMFSLFAPQEINQDELNILEASTQ